jgi:hypothetical protein
VKTNLLEVLALELSDDLVEALGVSVNADGGQNSLDVGGGGRLVAGKGEQKVGCEVLHFE